MRFIHLTLYGTNVYGLPVVENVTIAKYNIFERAWRSLVRLFHKSFRTITMTTEGNNNA